MKYRKLRIAWSVAWGVAPVLLAVLWVRSYWWSDGTSSAEVVSWRGNLCFLQTINYKPIPGIFTPVRTWRRMGIFTIDSKQIEILKRYGDGPSVPTWIPAIIALALSTAPWLRWRFSLRTLLIATTLVAVVLGAIVWAAK